MEEKFFLFFRNFSSAAMLYTNRKTGEMYSPLTTLTIGETIMIIKETLIQIENYPNYYISNMGKVYSKKRNGTYKVLKPFHAGSNWKTKSGAPQVGKYEVVSLYNEEGQVRRYVHQLVLHHFKGERPEGYQACHCDGNRLNNKLTNLRWDTHAANMEDAKRHRAERKLKATMKGAKMEEELEKEEQRG